MRVCVKHYVAPDADEPRRDVFGQACSTELALSDLGGGDVVAGGAVSGLVKGCAVL